MAARTGMTDIILALRGMVDAGTADYTLGTAVYWDDDQMQIILDRNRMDFYREELVSRIDYVGSGTIEYKEYRSQFQNIESGTAVFNLELATGVAAGTADYGVNYTDGVVTFDADQGGTAWFLSAKTYKLEAAAADIWRMKAAQSAKLYDVQTDGHRLSRSQIAEHCQKMATYYESFTEVSFADIYRSDM